MCYNYDYLFYIGRFQPFHFGHKYIVDKALQKAKQVIIICGSANIAHDTDNPWNFTYREKFIEKTMAAASMQRITIRSVADYQNDTSWKLKVVETVYSVVTGNNIGIIGHIKDKSSYYLKDFKKWPLEKVDNYQNINGTEIRKIISSSKKSETTKKLHNMLAKEVIEMLVQKTF